MNRSRLDKLAADLEPADVDYTEHWVQVCEDRLAAADEFLDSVQPRYRGRVVKAIGGVNGIGDLLLVRGVVNGEGLAALVLFFIIRTCWGESHPYNRTPLNPIPGALIDLLMKFPLADLWPCDECGIPLPQTPPSGQFDVKYVPGGKFVAPRFLAASCPVCEAVLSDGRK